MPFSESAEMERVGRSSFLTLQAVSHEADALVTQFWAEFFIHADSWVKERNIVIFI